MQNILFGLLFSKTSNPSSYFAVAVYEGEQLNLTRISRSEMGAYLCIASNSIPPSVSKRIIVDVECKYVQYDNRMMMMMFQMATIRPIDLMNIYTD